MVDPDEKSVDLFEAAKEVALKNKEYRKIYSLQYEDSDEKRYRIRSIQIGNHEMTALFASPFPDQFARMEKLYFCEFCLRYMKTPVVFERHMAKCPWNHPPGNEIYRKGNLSFFEVDGNKHKVYCQNLCLLAKLFLDHKTLFHEVEDFLFYILVQSDQMGCHLVGYFSKEKETPLNYNLSCLLTLPSYRRQGYGKLLIDFSYLLSRIDGRIGSPEKPLSDLGLLTYRAYWRGIILDYLIRHENDPDIYIKDITHASGVHSNDIVSTLQYMGVLKYWKGKHLIIKNKDMIQKFKQEKSHRRNHPTNRDIDPSKLRWVPPTDTAKA